MSEPPLLPESVPPIIGEPAAFPAAPALPLLPEANRRSGIIRRLIAILLSVSLGLFLADAIVSLADNSLILFFGSHVLGVIQGMVFLLAIFTGTMTYGLMGLTPMIPKRFFLPVALFNPLAGLALIPCSIYFYGRAQQMAWVISFCQAALGLGILRLVQRGFKTHWLLVPAERLGSRSFSWLNLSGFLLVNGVVLMPAVLVYLFFCAGLAATRFSDGFLTLRPGGLTVQMRKYVRDDGKTIHLYPMAHVGDASFYRNVSRSFPSNSIILMEGVSDDRNLLTNKITYKRMAKSLGLSEQQKEFKPDNGELVRADVDVEQFATNTIDFLNLVMLIHAKGVTAGNLTSLLQYSPPPDFEEQLWHDLLRNRNRHLLGEIQSRLVETENIIVPWGVAHMPEIAAEIQKARFRLAESKEYVVIRFWGTKKELAKRS